MHLQGPGASGNLVFLGKLECFCPAALSRVRRKRRGNDREVSRVSSQASFGGCEAHFLFGRNWGGGVTGQGGTSRPHVEDVPRGQEAWP